MAHITFRLADDSEVAFETGPEVVLETGKRNTAKGPQPVNRLTESRQSFEEALDAVSRMAGALITKFREALPEAPDELEIEFGLKASLEVNGFMVAKAGSEASYRVLLKWAKNETGPSSNTKE